MKKAGAKAPADFTNIPNYFFDGFLNWYKRWYKPRKIYENLREFGQKTRKTTQKTKPRNPLYYKGFRDLFLVETTGIEPVTPCMSSKYSNHLSYASVPCLGILPQLLAKVKALGVCFLFYCTVWGDCSPTSAASSRSVSSGV